MCSTSVLTLDSKESLRSVVEEVTLATSDASESVPTLDPSSGKMTAANGVVVGFGSCSNGLAVACREELREY
jgi:hypothetical protein